MPMIDLSNAEYYIGSTHHGGSGEQWPAPGRQLAAVLRGIPHTNVECTVEPSVEVWIERGLIKTGGRLYALRDLVPAYIPVDTLRKVLSSCRYVYLSASADETLDSLGCPR